MLLRGIVLALVVAASGVMGGCDTSRSVRLSAMQAEDLEPKTAGVPVKVSLPPTATANTMFPILVTFDGWTGPDEDVVLSWSDPSLVSAPQNLPVLAEAKVTPIMVRAASSVSTPHALTVTATTSKGSKSSTMNIVPQMLTLPAPTPVGTPSAVEVNDVIAGELVDIHVTMRDFQRAGLVSVVFVDSATNGAILRKPSRWRAMNGTWTMPVRIKSGTKEGEVCAVGLYTYPDQRDIVWGTFTVR